jgi:hypothetical protein
MVNAEKSRETMRVIKAALDCRIAPQPYFHRRRDHVKIQCAPESTKKHINWPLVGWGSVLA